MTEKIKVFSYFDRPPQVGLSCAEPSRTQQQFLQESDINYIVAKYADFEGFVDPSIPRKVKPQYGDFAELGDYQDHMNTVLKVQKIFDDLPADVRIQFENNPALFAEFASNPSNLEELAKIGVIDPIERESLEKTAEISDISTEKMETETPEKE